MVIDTNCVLDLWVFRDAGAAGLWRAVTEGQLQWCATVAMRDELARVLGYPWIATRLDALRCTPQSVLAQFDACARLEPAPSASCPVRCRDADDQMFIDLAAHRRAVLVSKDARVLELHRRLAPLGVDLARPWSDVASPSAPTPPQLDPHTSSQVRHWST